VQKERILSSYKERQHYEKPSDKKRRKINESKRKQLEFCSKGECVHTEHVSNRKRSE
jgi:ribosomal protein S21